MAPTDKEIGFQLDLGIAVRRLYQYHYPEITIPIANLIEGAPQELKDLLFAYFRSIDLLPEPDGYRLDGAPAYRLESIANKVGMLLADAEFVLDRINSERESLGFKPVLPAEQFHPKQ